VTSATDLPSASELELGLDVLLRDGSIGRVRSVRADDGPHLRALNARVSLRTRRMRYFSASDRPGEWYVDRLLQEGVRDEALVLERDGVVVALASFARTERDPGIGDLGLLVDDDSQHLGIGQLLLEHLATAARFHGVTTLSADVLQENTDMLSLLADSGFRLTRRGAGLGGIAQLTIDLRPRPELRDAVTSREVVAERASLAPLMEPRGIAVVGGRRPRSVASEIWASLERSRYSGVLRRVGPGQTVAGGPEIDLVVAAVPADQVLEVARDAADAGARALVVVSAGFAESGAEGGERQAALLSLCRERGLRLVGPNCLGIVSTALGHSFNATFCDAQPRPGGIALVSQSGAVGLAALRHAERRGSGLSAFVSTGNKADVSGNDLLAWFSEDPGTTAIAMYLESFGNAARFLRLASAVGRTKPVVVVKSGRTAAGAAAGQSHTAAAATPAIAIDALLRRAGAIRARDLSELFDVLSLLDGMPLPGGPRVAVIGNSGGPGVLAADACHDAGLELAALSDETQQALARIAPAGAALGNPVDLLATVGAEVFEQALQAVAADPAVDAIVTIYTPLLRGSEERYAAAVARVRRAHPDVPVIATFPGVAWQPAALPEGVPFFELPEPALHALGKLVEHVAWRERASSVAPTADGDLSGLRTALLPVVDDVPRWLGPSECQHLLQRLGIPCARLEEVQSAEAAAEAAGQIGYPVAVKASGPDLVHKSRQGAVLLGLRNRAEVLRAYRSLRKRLGDRMTSCVVQAMTPATDSIELLVGMTRDAAVGPLVAVAAGGTLTDVLDDRAIRLPSDSAEQALEQLSDLRCSRAFPAHDARPALDIRAAAEVVLAVSALARQVPEICELDINPLLVSPTGATAVDVRVRVRRAANPEDDGRRLSLPTPPSPRRSS